MRISATAALLSLVLGGLAQTQKAPTLTIGDDAPALSVGKWVKGGPVGVLKKGNVYVVEFWATWCGPCKVTIPHLNDLQKKLGDKATFIGVSSFETDWGAVEPFVKSEGDQMSYDVATDKLSNPADREGFMARNWMDASGQETIPTAFIVGKDGKIDWIGHPMMLEQPLTQVINGTFDRKAAAMEFQSRMQDEQKQKDEQAKQQQAQANSPANKLAAKFQEAIDKKDYPGALKVLDDLEKLDKRNEPLATLFRYRVYTLMGDGKQMSTMGKKLLEGPMKENATVLNEIAWSFVDPKGKVKNPDYDLAKQAATKAVDISKRQAEMLDTLAWVFYHSGDKSKAIELEKEALPKVQGDKTDYENALKTFQGK